MSKQCGFCGAVYWKKEKNTAPMYTKCCHDGKVQLPAFPVALELLKALLTENSTSLRWERKLNHYMKLDHTVTVYMVKCATEFPSLYASDQHKESYGQLYIFDSSEATYKRLSNNQNFLQHVFEKLDFKLREINSIAQSYLQILCFQGSQ
ncbi:hypothetical protein AVEN_132969-1 [Araneus ventricosus]|uniref:Uncharacterized protein n=1 Tax=Araneus ventricosus TaxID=182803 RepID=A0A4Y2SIQ3_ARAVE|nr:hypothetical protein AVEN_132969-1 [Araneus ventricosus]